jgi:hypothetical protein
MLRLLLPICTVVWLSACETDGQDPVPFECWYRTTAHGHVSAWGCPLAGCVPTGNGDEVICSCRAAGCTCGTRQDPENPEDGLQNIFACIREVEICYQGPPGQVWPPPLDCLCYAGFFCWMECEGRLTADGRMVCMVDGQERECREVPPQDELGRVVVCRRGAAPIEWPLPY